MKVYKLIVGVPVSHADAVREAVGKAGAGRIGNYDFCSFSVRGVGRFRPLKGAHPAIGTIGKIEEVEEEQIQMVCEEKFLPAVLKALNAAHPYETSAVDVFALEEIDIFNQ